MIELKNISKTYKSKTSKETKALNNISLKFNNNGMTFILGKSGSGKSTLLNIIGGLDKYDSGDLVILGKSSSDFTKSDFDSYRNTYIGFIFQEFNMLYDYDVYGNIALALQLQKKEINKSKIEELLEKLDLKGLEHRQINELSGGEKQRVAIARALIKNPKIILADEPTGNLDSKTGKQVMDLLKEISKEKLVIIVSHDIESAKKYSDRIIEIKDGSIVRDTNKCEYNNIKYKYETIKSKLPFVESIKLGIKNLKHKKIKLLMTISLSIVVLLFLGIISTISSYDINLAHSRLLVEKEEKFIQIEKNKLIKSDDYINKKILELNNDDISFIEKNVSSNTNLIYRLRDNEGIYSSISSAFDLGQIDNGDGQEIIEIIEVNDFDEMRNFKIYGSFPKNDNEIVISNYVANLFIKYGIKLAEENTYYTPSNYQDIINNSNYFSIRNNKKIKISGIIKYNINESSNPLLENVYNKIYVKKGFVKSLLESGVSTLDINYDFKLNSKNIELNNDGPAYTPNIITPNIEYYNGKQWLSSSDLKENEIVLNVNQLRYFNKEEYLKGLRKYINTHINISQLEAEKQYFEKYVSNYDAIGKNLNLIINNIELETIDSNYNDLVVVGLCGLITNNDYNFYLSNKVLSKYYIESVSPMGILVFETSAKKFEKIMNTFPLDSEFSAKSTYTDDVSQTYRTILVIKNRISILFVSFLIFSIILISNFIWSSILYRKKEIGILKGLGARNIDIISIFLCEASLIAIFTTVISYVLLPFIINFLNNEFSNLLILPPFLLTIKQFILIFSISFIIVYFSTLIAILKMLRNNPMLNINS